MDLDDAVRGARLLASDIETSLGFAVDVETGTTDKWRRFAERTGRPEPKALVRVAVPDVGTAAALDPTEPGSATAEEFAMELAQILQDDIQIHIREPWPKDPTASGRSLEPTERGWQSLADRAYLVQYGQLGNSAD
ncbi:hypothetical protein [Nocardia sp. NPDC047648]|uniref:hypothetical protein n=1 Tax=Nocardia sp. NPDC047648 TaxID=3155625 RepID=UPI0033CA2E56